MAHPQCREDIPRGFNHFSLPVPIGRSRIANPSLHSASCTIRLCAFTFSSSTSTLSSPSATPNARPSSNASTTTVLNKKFKSDPKGGHLSPIVSAGDNPTILFPFFGFSSAAPLATRLRLRLLLAWPLFVLERSRARCLASPAAYNLDPTTGVSTSSASLKSASWRRDLNACEVSRMYPRSRTRCAWKCKCVVGLRKRATSAPERACACATSGESTLAVRCERVGVDCGREDGKEARNARSDVVLWAWASRFAVG